jgi:hypothetical protein
MADHCADMSNPVLIKGTTMPPAKNSTPSDLLPHKPTNSGEEPVFLIDSPSAPASVKQN